MFFVLPVVMAIIGLTLGGRLQQRHAQLSLIGSLLFAVACFVIYAVGTNYSRAMDDVALRRTAQYVAAGSWAGLYFASGIFGPALSRSGALPVALSVAATIATLTLGTWGMFTLACRFAGECL